MNGNRFRVGVFLLAGILLFTLGSAPVIAAAGMPAPTLTVDGKEITLAAPLGWDQGSALISLADLADCLDASFCWNDEQTVWIQKYGCTILFRLAGAGQVLKNSEPIALPVKARTIDGVFYLPLRFLAESLKATVHWDGSKNRIEITTGERQEPPARVGGQAFNAVVAYIDADQLWLLDGRNPQIKPKQITDSGKVELVAWSGDGHWLAYKHRAAGEDGPTSLWVTRADGSQVCQVDLASVIDEVSWAPQGERLAYVSRERDAHGNMSASVLKWAEIAAADIRIETLVEEGNAAIISLAWHPDGHKIALSRPRTEEGPPFIEQVDLAGNRSLLHTFVDPEAVDPELHTWAFISLNWSPAGKHLAYHLRKNSASLTADVVETRVLNIETGQELELSPGLSYPQWLAYSPAGEQLASIAGVGRDLVSNKRLEVVDLVTGQIADRGQDGQVDSQPVWLPGAGASVLFCRGPEADQVSNLNDLPGVMVPQQRIYQLDEEGRVRALTSGPASTADYYPTPSPSGEELLFLRLERYDQGSLYLQPLTEPDQEQEIVRGLRGSPGYYGNYYPQWISVYWF